MVGEDKWNYTWIHSLLKGVQFLALQFTLETESTEEEQISEFELNDVFADDLLNRRKQFCLVFIYWEFLKNDFVWVLFCPNLSKNVLPLLSVSALQVFTLHYCGKASLTPSPFLMFLCFFVFFPFSFPHSPHTPAPLCATDAHRSF